MESLQCPKCRAPMTPVQVEHALVDRCPSCEGLWFDALEDRDASTPAEVDALDPPGASAKPGRDAQTRVDCPRCHTPMIRMLDRATREVWYENCPICYGKFFDAGEFRAVQPRTLMDAFRRWIGKAPH